MSNADTGEVEQRITRLEQQDQRMTRALELLAEREAAPAGRPRRDWDAFAAVIASFIGLLALAVSGYTAYVQRQQLRAQVWPHLVVDSSNVDPESSWSVTNQGTGPARVIAMRVVVDGAPVTTWGDVKKVAGYSREEGIVTSWISHVVIPPGKQIAIVKPDDKPRSPAKFRDLLPDGKHELAVTLCYCSVLNDCWDAGANLPQGDGVYGPPDSCPITVDERFVQ